MTRMIEKKYHLWLMIVAVLAAIPAAQAALTYLPESSYYYGQTHYTIDLGNGQILSGRIEFAVYDTQAYPGEFTGTAPGSGRYIYAYQIFQNSGASNIALTTFVVDGIGEGAIPADNPNSYIGTDNSVPGVDASLAFFNASRTQGEWDFQNPSIQAGENSVFLLIRSNNSIKAGTYQLFPPEDSEIPVPGDEDGTIPEPATVMILSLGTALAIRSRR